MREHRLTTHPEIAPRQEQYHYHMKGGECRTETIQRSETGGSRTIRESFVGTTHKRWPKHQLEYRDDTAKKLIAMRRQFRPIRRRRDLPAEVQLQLSLIEIDLRDAIIALNHAGAGIAMEDKEPSGSSTEQKSKSLLGAGGSAGDSGTLGKPAIYLRG